MSETKIVNSIEIKVGDWIVVTPNGIKVYRDGVDLDKSVPFTMSLGYVNGAKPFGEVHMATREKMSGFRVNRVILDEDMDK